MTKALYQIAKITEALSKLRAFGNDNGGLAGLLAKLDAITADYTAFKKFFALVNAPNYFPSIRTSEGGEYSILEYRLPSGRVIIGPQYYAELDLLALCYDMAQEARGDSRRAFRS